MFRERDLLTTADGRVDPRLLTLLASSTTHVETPHCPAFQAEAESEIALAEPGHAAVKLSPALSCPVGRAISPCPASRGPYRGLTARSFLTGTSVRRLVALSRASRHITSNRSVESPGDDPGGARSRLLSSVTNFRPPCVTKSAPPLRSVLTGLSRLDRVNKPSSRAVETVGSAERFPRRLRAASVSTAFFHASFS